jgi:hypothetical protein
MERKTINQAATLLHGMTAAIASFKANVTGMDALIDAERDAGTTGLDELDKDLDHVAKRLEKLEAAKTAFHERASRMQGDVVLKIGT